MPNNIKPVLALITVSAIWGGASVVIKYTLDFIPPFSFLYIRFVVASIILYFLVDWKKHKYLMNVKKGEFIKIFSIGALGSAVNLGLYFLGIKYTTAIEATIIYSFSPVFVLLGSIIILKERVSKIQWLGLAVILLGFLLVVVRPFTQTQNLESGLDSNLFGNILILLSVLAWSTYTLVSKNIFNHDKSGEKFSPLFITFITFFSGAITLMPIGLYEIWTAEINYVKSIPGLLYMTILSTVVAYSFFEYGVKKIKASQASIFQYIQPLFTIPLAILFLGEKFSMYYLLGGILLLVGLYFSESGEERKNGRTEERKNGRTEERKNGRTEERKNGRTEELILKEK